MFYKIIILAVSCFALNNKPNIVIYLTDDLGIGAIDNNSIKTPFLLKFKKESLEMTHTYSNAVCSPSRWEILTGSNEVDRNGVDGMVSIPEITLPKSLLSMGYNTAIIGKYGHGDGKSIGSAKLMGFNYSYVYPTHESAHILYPQILEKNGIPISINNGKVSRKYCKKFKNKCIYSADLFLKESLAFIDENKNGPFFLLWSTTLPHLGVYKKIKEKYKFPVPELGEYKNIKSMTYNQKSYASMITNYIDRDMQYLENKLIQCNIKKNTIVIFLSDNGPEKRFGIIKKFNLNKGLRGYKTNLYEGGVRVHGLIRWPDVISPGTSDFPWKIQNLLPTLTSISGNTVIKPNTYDLSNVWTYGDIFNYNFHIKHCGYGISGICKSSYYYFKNNILLKKINGKTYNLTNNPFEKD